jgi:hypothetical protein
MSRHANLVSTNIDHGTAKTRTFKVIIQEALYPKNPEYFSAGSIACALRIVEAFKKDNGTISELIDLMIFYVECGTQFTADYGDMDEDFYNELGIMFEETLSITKDNLHLISLDKYKRRLEKILETSHAVGWGYPDQLDELLQNYFPETFGNPRELQ